MGIKPELDELRSQERNVYYEIRGFLLASRPIPRGCDDMIASVNECIEYQEGFHGNALSMETVQGLHRIKSLLITRARQEPDVCDRVWLWTAAQHVAEVLMEYENYDECNAEARMLFLAASSCRALAMGFSTPFAGRDGWDVSPAELEQVRSFASLDPPFPQ